MLFGASAFYDLETTGRQARMATDLRPGEQCIVATPADGGEVVFGWFALSHEELMPDPSKPGTMVRVFIGQRTQTKRMSKAAAATTAPYSVFFDARGHFKHPSVINPPTGIVSRRPSA
jgi:hypothetical protein